MFDIETIDLQAERFASTHETCRRLLDELGYDHTWHSHDDYVTENLVRTLHAYVWSRKENSKSVSYPADWFEAFKERWFPKWALKRWPVKITTVTFEATSLYPTIKLRPESHKAHLRIAVAQFTAAKWK